MGVEVHSLTSHYDSYIRIDSEKCARILGDTYDFDAENAYEITGAYSDSEQCQLKEFRTRLQKIVNYMPDYKYCVLYKDLQNKALGKWKADDESILCEKLQLAFRGIQSDRNNVNLNENGINNQVAYFLRGYYGENNIHREEPRLRLLRRLISSCNRQVNRGWNQISERYTSFKEKKLMVVNWGRFFSRENSHAKRTVPDA